MPSAPEGEEFALPLRKATRGKKKGESRQILKTVTGLHMLHISGKNENEKELKKSKEKLNGIQPKGVKHPKREKKKHGRGGGHICLLQYCYRREKPKERGWFSPSVKFFWP